MSKIEYSIIPFSKCSSEERIDSEFYQDKFLNLEKINSRFKTTIKDIDLGINKNTKSTLPVDIKYIEISNVSCSTLDYDFRVIHAGEPVPDRAQNVLEGKTILVSTVRPNRNAVAYVENLENSIASSGFKVIRVNEEIISSEYIYCLCKTNYFIQNLIRKNKATMYPAVSNSDVDAITFPIYEKLSIEIAKVFKESNKKMLNSKEIYESAIKQLEGLFSYNRQNTNSYNTKKLSETFGYTGRLDAEYYQTKFDSLRDCLSKINTDILDNLVKIKKSIEPGSDVYCDEGIPFIRVANLFESGIREPDIMLPFDLLENPSDLYVKKGTILLSKDGSVGTAYKVDENLNAITSSAILHLIADEDKIDSDYLTLVLNSDIVRMQAERETNNAVIQHWTIDSVKKTIIPLVERSIQMKLADMVKESKKLRKESELLIKKAIKSMEIAIKDGEEKALSYLTTI